MANLYRLHGAEYTPEELKEAYQRLNMAQQEQMRFETREQMVEIDLVLTFRQLFTEKGASADTETAAAMMRAFRAASTQYFRLYPGTKEMLLSLRQRGIRVALLSNAQRLFTEPELKALGIWDCFDRVLISSDCGVKKPSSAFYRRLLEWAAVPPEQVLMVGNSPRDDIVPARALGLCACYIPSTLTEKDAVRPESELYLPEPDMPRLTRLLTQDAD